MDNIEEQLENMNINTTMSLSNHKPLSNNTNLLNNLQSLDTLDDLIDMVEGNTASQINMTQQEPNLNLEVRNIYCRKHFDDEDFIYMKMDLPSELLNQIELFSNGDLSTDAMYSFLSSAMENKVNINTTLSDRFQLINYLFSQVRYYYDVIEIDTHDDSHYFQFDEEFMDLAYKLTTDLIDNVNFDLNDESNKGANTYEKEVLYGCSLIIHQIQIIIHSYLQINITNVNEIHERHHTRLLRLINNLCVCLYYFNFKLEYMEENGYEADTETDTPDDWKILTEP